MEALKSRSCAPLHLFSYRSSIQQFIYQSRERRLAAFRCFIHLLGRRSCEKMDDKAQSDSSLFNIPLNSESGSGSELDIGDITTHSNGSDSMNRSSLAEADENPDEAAEKARLICQVLELQDTLEDLSQRVDSVKEENLKLKSENQVLGQYIENLMASSSVFQNTNAKNKKK